MSSKPCLFLVQYELVAQVIEFTQHVSNAHLVDLQAKGWMRVGAGGGWWGLVGAGGGWWVLSGS